MLKKSLICAVLVLLVLIVGIFVYRGRSNVVTIQECSNAGIKMIDMFKKNNAIESINDFSFSNKTGTCYFQIGYYDGTGQYVFSIYDTYRNTEIQSCNEYKNPMYAKLDQITGGNSTQSRADEIRSIARSAMGLDPDVKKDPPCNAYYKKYKELF